MTLCWTSTRSLSPPCGWTAAGSTYKDEYANPDAVNGVFNQYRKSLCVGLEAFIGLQAFIADLPVSVGFEYGLSGMFHTGQKVKTEVYDAVNNTTQTTYQLLGDPTDYKDLKAK